MKLILSVIATIFILAACTSPNYENEDVVAKLKEEEIKIEDILWQFSLEENPEKVYRAYLQQEIMVHEAKDMGIVVTEEEIAESKQAIFPGAEAEEIIELTDSKDFYEAQSSKLGISSEAYFEGREDRMHRVQAYMEKYIEAKFGDPVDDEEDVHEWGQDIDSHFEDLLDRYIEDGDLIIKY